MQGELLAGRFRIGDRLGAGGMGQVWAAQDERMRRDVAVKVVHPQYGMDEAETQARFQREVQLAGRLSHQNIVTVHDWGEVSVDGRRTLFLVMELVHGVPLHRRLAESTPAWPLAVGWGAQIAEALAAAHEEGVVHRDIKPANVLLTPSGTVKVLDFGVAKFMGETIGARELTVTGVPLGSPPYMSPEQADGDRAIDHRSDLYSLGCLLYHAVTGRQPFTGSSQWAVLRKQMEAVPEPPGVYAEGLPSSLDDLILKLLAKRPEDRPADAVAVYESLCALLADHLVTEPGVSILDVTQLGRSHSVAKRILREAWELLRWTEWNKAEQRKAADLHLTRARAAADQILLNAHAAAETLRSAARSAADADRHESQKLLAKARREADSTMELAEEIVADAAVEAQKNAEEVLGKASEEAAGTIRDAAEEAERIRRDATDAAHQLRADAMAEAKKFLAEADRPPGQVDKTVGESRPTATAAGSGSRLLDRLRGGSRAEADEQANAPRQRTDETPVPTKGPADVAKPRPAVRTDESNTWRPEVEEILKRARRQSEARRGDLSETS
ncbi:protein kinase [Streptomyces sp. NBC_00988]|uniref:serine/threonine-protein kinase n=1 Tax=Streptomyces sp. NBC_00988 TaxID=2903704 RepID=UPI00386FAF0E|nr:protein kinase [Streptomyces sp. NBC_00988]